MTKRKPKGHPAKTDPSVDKMFRVMRASVELVKELNGKLTPENDVNLRASALGMMYVYSELTGLPSPSEVINKDL